MKCTFCGVELPDEAKFCYSCGKKVEKEALCPKCGTKLQKDAKYCMECGTCVSLGEVKESPEKPRENILSENTNLNQPSISLDRLSPYANHTEYYREGYWKYQEVFANNGIVCCKKFDVIRVFDECSPQNYVKVKNIPSDYTMLGMNNMGLYFADWKYDTERAWLHRILVYDLEGTLKQEIPFNRKKEEIKEIYIYGERICCVAQNAQEQSSLYYFKASQNNAAPIYIVNPSKHVEIDRVSANEKLVAYNMRITGTVVQGGEKEEVSSYGTYLYDCMEGTIRSISNGSVQPERCFKEPRLFLEESLSRVDVFRVFLEQGIIWTQMLPEEERKYGNSKIKKNSYRKKLEETAVVARTFSSDGKLLPMITGYGIVDLARDHKCVGGRCNLQYFDGGDRFYQDTYLLKRVDRNYDVATIGDQLHGEADKTTVTEEFVYTKAERDVYKKYPREFQSFEGAIGNPEAVDLF